MLGTVIIVILILMLIGVLPTWSHSASWGCWCCLKRLSTFGAVQDLPQLVGFVGYSYKVA